MSYGNLINIIERFLNTKHLSNDALYVYCKCYWKELIEYKEEAISNNDIVRIKEIKFYIGELYKKNNRLYLEKGL